MTLPEEASRTIDAAVAVLRRSRSLLFITGAGLSADSGLPTYRGIGGLYEGAETEEGLPIEEALSGETLRRRPELSWKYLGRIEAAARGARPNRGHEVIAEMEGHFERVWTLTQNVDGFHRQAGSKNVLEIHGDMHKLFCPACGLRRTAQSYAGLTLPPPCPRCPALLRPAVVLFGEMLPEDVLAELHDQCSLGFDAVLSVGTTSVFPYIREPVLLAKSRGRPTIEINPGETGVTSVVDVKIALGAAEALDELWRRYLSQRR
jgi:NAD-dependent deacetylase